MTSDDRIREAEAHRARLLAERNEVIDAFESEWLTWQTPAGGVVPVPRDWERSVARFAKLGLRGETIRYLVNIAMQARTMPVDDRFRYFCGCCWRTIEETRTEVLGDDDRPVRRRIAELADGSVWLTDD